MENLKTFLKKKGRKKTKTKRGDSEYLSLPFIRRVRVLPELSQCSGKLSIGTHDSTQTNSHHKSPLCKKYPATHTHTHTHTSSCTEQTV